MKESDKGDKIDHRKVSDPIKERKDFIDHLRTNAPVDDSKENENKGAKK